MSRWGVQLLNKPKKQKLFLQPQHKNPLQSFVGLQGIFSLVFQIDRPQIQQVAAGEANLLVQVGVD